MGAKRACQVALLDGIARQLKRATVLAGRAQDNALPSRSVSCAVASGLNPLMVEGFVSSIGTNLT